MDNPLIDNPLRQYSLQLHERHNCPNCAHEAGKDFLTLAECDTTFQTMEPMQELSYPLGGLQCSKCGWQMKWITADKEQKTA